MKFHNIKEAARAAQIARQETKLAGLSRTHYSLEFKKAAIDCITQHQLSIKASAKELGVTPKSIRNWLEQYQSGLLTVSAATSVSKVAQTTNQSIMKSLRKDIAKLERKLQLVEECEALGMAVSM